MTIIKSAMTLIGFVACIINSLPAATAAPVSYDKYFVVSQGTFQVNAFGSTDWYLNISGGANVYLSSPSASPNTYPTVGILTPPNGSNIPGSQWYPGTFNYYCPSPTIHLTEESGIDKYGSVKLVVTVPFNCFSAGGGSSFSFSASRGQPQRITTLNGDQIEALPIIIQLGDSLWATYYFGYGVGVVAAFPFNASLEVPEFYPVSLPPPKADGTVVEYVNTADFPNAPGGHYFYSSDPAEQAAVDAGRAGQFVRTGRSFASGGFVPVCRFYGSMSPGPNSHFFTASESECAGLRSLQVTPVPNTTQQWNFEGSGFYSVVPVQGAQGQMQCMTGTVPVHRAYNNAYPKNGGKNPWDSNHRYSTQSTDIDEMVSKGWASEGVVFCAPVAVQ